MSKKYVPKMTHDERAMRRAAIADFVHKGNTFEEAAEEYDVSINTVRDACRIHGVPYLTRESGNDLADETYRLIAALILENHPLAVFAENFGISKQRVHFVRKKCADAGIPLGVGDKLTVSV